MRAAVTLGDIAAIEAETETEALAQVEALLWPQGPVCPKCGGVNHAYRVPRTGSPWANYWRCANRNCRASFSAKLGTVFQGSTNLGWRNIIAMCRVVANDNAPLLGQVALAGGLSGQAARKWWLALPQANARGTIWDAHALQAIAATYNPERTREQSRLQQRRDRAKRRARRAAQRVAERHKQPPPDRFYWDEVKAMRSATKTVASPPVLHDMEGVKESPQFPPACPHCKGTEFYWLRSESQRLPGKSSAFRCKRCKRDTRYPLTRQQRKEIDKIGAIDKIEQDMVANPEDYFSPEETERRFNAVLKAAINTPPKPHCRKCGSAKTRAVPTKLRDVSAHRCIDCGFVWQINLPHLHELSTEEMERRAELRVQERRARLTAAEQAALDAYAGKITKGKPRAAKGLKKSPKLKREPSELRKFSEEALELCIGLGLSAEEAAARVPGASPYIIANLLQQKRKRGESLGLYVKVNRKRQPRGPKHTERKPK
jgi:transposase-like protein